MVKNLALAAIVGMFATTAFADTKKEEMPAKDDAATTAPEKDAKMDEKEAKK